MKRFEGKLAVPTPDGINPSFSISVKGLWVIQ